MYVHMRIHTIEVRKSPKADCSAKAFANFVQSKKLFASFDRGEKGLPRLPRRSRWAESSVAPSPCLVPARPEFSVPAHFENDLRVCFFRLEKHKARIIGLSTCTNRECCTVHTRKPALNFKPESIFRSEWGQKIQFSSRTDQRRKQRGVRMAGGGVC